MTLKKAPSFSKPLTKDSISDNLSVLTPLDGNESEWVILRCLSKHVYSIVTKPISVEHVTPRIRAIEFIESRTRQAPVPQDNKIIPTRPMIVDFSFKDDLIEGVCPLSFVTLAQGISI